MCLFIFLQEVVKSRRAAAATGFQMMVIRKLRVVKWSGEEKGKPVGLNNNKKVKARVKKAKGKGMRWHHYKIIHSFVAD